jgi:hypothetical protein
MAANDAGNADMVILLLELAKNCAIPVKTVYAMRRAYKKFRENHGSRVTISLPEFVALWAKSAHWDDRKHYGVRNRGAARKGHPPGWAPDRWSADTCFIGALDEGRSNIIGVKRDKLGRRISS